MSSAAASTSKARDEQSFDVEPVDRVAMYRRIAWRLMPFLIISYVINAIDRTNISMAQLRMESDLGFTAEIYGIGVGIFYLGYVMFEVPSNVLLERVGIRKTLLRIMALWGIVSSCTMFVTTPTQFYIVRFLLGIAEA
ncbi:MAG: MFS transporter, partial [Sphingobium sp.]